MHIPLDSVRVLERFDAWKKKNGKLPFPIVPGADKFVISFVRENYRAVSRRSGSKRASERRYRYGIAAHVLGYVGEVRRRELARPDGVFRRVTFRERRGWNGSASGVSAAQDGQLAVEVNGIRARAGRDPGAFDRARHRANGHLYLTSLLQCFLDSLLSLRPNPGAAVVLDVHTGAILAATSHPPYDPNEFARGVSRRS